MSSPKGIGSGSIFRWDTLIAVRRHDLLFQGRSVTGTMYEVSLMSGRVVSVWRSVDGNQFFCHGLTFGGKEASGGIASPYTGWPIETILADYYDMIAESAANLGDVVVWRGNAPETTPHSAILTHVVVGTADRLLAYSARLQTKNGLMPEANMSLDELVALYGEAYQIYRRR